jgi:hypothetical protein
MQRVTPRFGQRSFIPEIERKKPDKSEDVRSRRRDPDEPRVDRAARFDLVGEKTTAKQRLTLSEAAASL